MNYSNSFIQDVCRCKKEGKTLTQTIVVMKKHPKKPPVDSLTNSVIISTYNRTK